MINIRFIPGRQYKFRFKNYRGAVETRHVIVTGLAYVQNTYYPVPSWCMTTWDIERGEPRSFGLDRIELDTVVEQPL